MARQDYTLLGDLHHAHELLQQLLLSVPEKDCYRSFHPDLCPLAWYFGRAVYLELHLLRYLDARSADLAERVAHLFSRHSTAIPQGRDASELPPREHLLNWALESFDRHMTLLANPHATAPDFGAEKSDNNALIALLQQAQAELYESMLNVLQQRALEQQEVFHVVSPLTPAAPSNAMMVTVNQGHYRIGAREGLVFAREQPPQSVELHHFRIARRPVSNQDYLSFMTATGAAAPAAWQADAKGHWYEVALNGAAGLVAQQPVIGVSLQQARDYVAWLALQPGFSGAVLQHEYQWEVSARMGLLEQTGRVWEWCANTPLAYPGFEPDGDDELRDHCLNNPDCAVLRGASLHTQPVLRRASYRLLVAGKSGVLFSGIRVVLPPLG